MLNYFLPVIVFFGLITSFEDITYGKIKNKYIIFAIVYAIIVYLILILVYSFQGTFRIQYLSDLIINLLFTIMVGFFLWKSKIWTSGDGKLFIAYAFLVPLTEYSKGYITFFPSMTLLINTFVPFVIYAIIVLFFFTTIKQKMKVVTEIKIKQVGWLSLSLFALSWLSDIFLLYLGIRSNFFMNIFVIFILIALAQKIFPDKINEMIICMGILRILLDWKFVFTFEFLNEFLGLMLCFFLLRFFFLKLSFDVFSKKVPIDRLKNGMILADGIYYDKKMKKYKKERRLAFDVILGKKNKKNNQQFNFLLEELRNKDIEKLIELKKQKKLSFNHLKIQQTLSFAPFMFAGTLITILIKGQVFVWIRSIIP